MKKAILMVAVFLVGAATQAMANHQTSVERTPIKRAGFNFSKEVQFVEQGILYTIASNGTFTFKKINGASYSMYRHPNKIDRRRGRYLKSRNNRLHIVKDRFGNIRSINNTRITYKRNGKVKTVGTVSLQYQRGRLTHVGNMKLVYNRFGAIRNTIGHVNKFNEKFWHDDWYVYNDRYNDDENGRRVRTK
ncbi:hypothetical protein G5B37_03215 [Rasiella rasia]|uniref:Uncharacterized protein n=1 Tax=Rasiella rasia TaxID=2744027 RepID=A0A6G6GJK8_9FLAO|nr:hypothetical protein [Rasiella rasia]QIE58603.1 hypothetical protein G5B37_03215 [Rasiella rasia]